MIDLPRRSAYHMRLHVVLHLIPSVTAYLFDGYDLEKAAEMAFNELVIRNHGGDGKRYVRDFVDILTKEPSTGLRSTGYVVDTLATAFWAFRTSNSYRECVLKAVNLGGDTDTAAAVAGGLAGLYYGIGGEKGIPQEWIDQLAKVEYITSICDKLAARLA